MIRTDYYLGRKLVKVTYGRRGSNAAINATRHFQWNEYGADRMEAYDTDSGKLLAQMTAKLNGVGPLKITIVYESPGSRLIKSEKPAAE